MRINRLLYASVVAVALTGGYAAISGPAGAAVTPASAIPAANQPAGYSIQVAGFTMGNDEQAVDTVACPSGTVPWGGGAKIDENTLGAHLNSSYGYSGEAGSGWLAAVNNTTGSNLTFSVYAVCADRPASYKLVTGTAQDDPAGSRAGTFAACPKGTVSLGGGGASKSSDTSVDLNGIQPITGDGIYNFEVYMNNASASDSSFEAQVVCGKKPTGYVVKSAKASNPSRKDSSAHASCPAKSAVVGGGVLSSSINLAVDVTATAPDNDGAWVASEANSSTSNASVTSFAICAK
jgi:hypothetical protein